jgi:hypothetical protein
MQFQDHPAPPPPTPRGPSRAVWVAAIATALLVVVAVAAFLMTRTDGEAVGSPSLSPESSVPQTTASPTTTTIDTETEVVARLREIMRVREEAFARRDASLFAQVYTSDCPCLKAGRDAIAALTKENVVWKGRSVSIQVQSTQRISDRLWEVVAIFTSKPFRIETEDGALIRTASAERITYRFLLFRPSDGEQWLLGNASVLKGA